MHSPAPRRQEGVPVPRQADRRARSPTSRSARRWSNRSKSTDGRIAGIRVPRRGRLQVPGPSCSRPARSCRALMHTGEEKTPGGRGGDVAAARAFRRASGRSASSCAVQDRHAAAAQRPDHRLRQARAPAGRRRARAVLVPDRPHRHSRRCTATSPATNPAVHDVIRDNLHRAPMYSGQIQSTGPRYCPSIEDKIVRFADRESHQIFLEPGGPQHAGILLQRHLHQPAPRCPGSR